MKKPKNERANAVMTIKLSRFVKPVSKKSSNKIRPMPSDRSTDLFCWLHFPITNATSKKKLDSVRLKRSQYYGTDGKLHNSLRCPRCGMHKDSSTSRPITHEGAKIEGYTLPIQKHEL